MCGVLFRSKGSCREHCMAFGEMGSDLIQVLQQHGGIHYTHALLTGRTIYILRRVDHSGLYQVAMPFTVTCALMPFLRAVCIFFAHSATFLCSGHIATFILRTYMLPSKYAERMVRTSISRAAGWQRLGKWMGRKGWVALSSPTVHAPPPTPPHQVFDRRQK
ncbi:hypothetical protein BDV95DRAFT_203441 [Massariosphaeria phaeospora]|uniref:Uncharacterized protein n=1 Tax=Massariosphaeria phaeospora TaxID=100035 RepID=A0A7C8M3K7_9PLEO|nr:hypothetical protein BDV95DRAFT_203441 [Massariosphaeria phaeospora]